MIAKRCGAGFLSGGRTQEYLHQRKPCYLVVSAFVFQYWDRTGVIGDGKLFAKILAHAANPGFQLSIARSSWLSLAALNWIGRIIQAVLFGFGS